MTFDLLARFTRFLNLVVAQALAIDPRTRWMAEGWEHVYVVELGGLNGGRTLADEHRAWEAAC